MSSSQHSESVNSDDPPVLERTSNEAALPASVATSTSSTQHRKQPMRVTGHFPQGQLRQKQWPSSTASLSSTSSESSSEELPMETAVPLSIATTTTTTATTTTRPSKGAIKRVRKSRVVCIATMQVHQASRLVAQQLRLAPEVSPSSHLQAAVAVEHFGRQVFLPYILAQQQALAPNSRKPPKKESDRIFYATLLALREVLAQNAERFFLLPAASDSDDNLLSKDDIEEEKAYTKLLLANAIVMAACQAAGKDEDFLSNTILKDDFPADRMTPSVTLRTPSAGGTTPTNEHSVMFKAGFNVALEKRAAAAKQLRTSIPEPTACWVPVVEEIPAVLKKKRSNYDA